MSCKKWVSKKEEGVAGRVTKIVKAGVTKNAPGARGSGEAERAGGAEIGREKGAHAGKVQFLTSRR